MNRNVGLLDLKFILFLLRWITLKIEISVVDDNDDDDRDTCTEENMEKRHWKNRICFIAYRASKPCGKWPLWPDWAVFCFLGKHSKLATSIILAKSPTLLGNFWKVSKSFIFLVNSFLGNFYRHLAIFYWSHCKWCTTSLRLQSRKLWS